jgi:hypothetical protein
MARLLLQRRLGSGIGLLIVVLLLLLPGHRRGDLSAQAPDPCAANPVNPIACENSKPGNPASEWDISGSGSAAIQGFATDISVNRGGTVGFKVSTTASSYRIDIYRLGYYNGSGARLVAQVLNPTATNQAACVTEASTGLVDCGNWTQSASWPVPATAVSGIYIAKLVRTDTTAGSSHIVFVVRDDTGQSDVLFQTSDTTWQAYNTYGGNSLYVGSPAGRAYKVSYNRPFTTRGNAPEDWLFNAEYPMLRWLEANGYNVSYTTGVDSDRLASELLEHRVFMSVGHDEYWSGQQRANVEAARAAGVNLAFFSGNEVFWKTRWENSIAGASTAHRTLVCYKETHANAKIDPLPNVWTGTWRDPRFSPPDDGGRPENALTGTIFTVNAGTTAITVPEPYGKLRLWRNTTVATLAAGQTATLAAGTLGYEWDEDLANGARPAGLLQLSSTTRSGVEKLLDYGSSYGNGTATHSLTMYKAPSGALVFGAGTVQWSWGLDAAHDRTPSTPDVRMRQATVNLLADMNAQPSTLQAGLVAAVRTTDTAPPTSVISSPAAGASLAGNTPVVISGTASDSGGVVAGVEVSVDGGATWAAATGRAAWTYAWVTPGSGSATIRARAIDDSGNLQVAVTSVTVSISGGGGTPTGPVAAYSFSEGSGTTTADVTGRGNTGTLAGATWTTAGRNGTALSFNGTSSMVTIADAASLDLTSAMTMEAWVRPAVATSWRTVILKESGTNGLAYALYATNGAAPSFYLNNGSNDFNADGTSQLPLNTWTHLAATYDGSTLRLYVNGTLAGTRTAAISARVSTSPLRIGGNAIWDEFFSGQIDDVRLYSRALSASEVTTDMNTPVAPPDTAAPAVSSVVPAAGAVNVNRTSTIAVRFSEPMLATSIDTGSFQLRDAAGQLVAGTMVYDNATLTATFTPGAPLADGMLYTASVRGGTVDPRVKDLAGNALGATFNWTFTVAPRGMFCPCTLWDSAQGPLLADAGDVNAVELGVKFRSDRSGYITGLRFYKAALNTGTHVGNLWTEAGVQLASVTFLNETGSGWQQMLFGRPVAVTAGTTYVASYHAPAGHYPADVAYFASGFDAVPLHAVSNVTSPNGVFRYGPSGFPTQSFNANNYWVDVVFADTVVFDTTPPVVTAQSPAPSATGIPFNTTVSATFNEYMDASTINSNTVELRQGATVLPSSVSYNAGARTLTLTPAAGLVPTQVYTVVLRGGATDPRVKDAAGNAPAADITWSFTSANPPANDGPGGPILVVGSTTNAFGRYYAEILRNEGFNLFTGTDISQVTSTMLNSYDVVILGEMSLTPAQVTMFSTWVTAGGNLIAMRPDKQLASLLGLTDEGTTLANAYLQVAQSGAGAGIVADTIQFHGTADRYALSGASAIATLYSSSTVATTNPAVTMRSVGAAGGQAAAFSYDLARSVVYTRQGNPAWAGQERDGVAPVRSDDMFFGGNTGTDWIDLNKVAIPQADEQQRLLANMILQMNLDRKPLPRFFYLPRMLKAAVVMTGDDHAVNGTPGRFDIYAAASPAGCNVANWECIRATSYIYANTAISNAQAVGYVNAGFEIALHLTTNCQNYTAASLAADWPAQLAAFTSKYSGVPAPTTNRTHCIAFSDWASQPKYELSRNIRLDTNYYYWPSSWLLDRPGHFTGSGLPMRFADLDGTTIDVYQANTQMTDESGLTYSTHINTLLDNALGPLGYYAVVTTNMHTDAAVHAGSEAIVTSATARNVPIVSARQMLTWLDGRNNSAFAAVAATGGTVTFSITQAAGATGLYAMLPAQGASGPLTALTRAGSAVAYTLETIKGVQYAVFPATAGAYSASYVSAPNTTITGSPAASTTSTSATFTFTSTPAGATFQCSLNGAAYTTCTSGISYSGLALATHTFNVRAVNANGTDPTPATFTWTIAGVVPDTTITSAAPSTSSTSATFTFTSTPAGATFQCSLDGAAYTTCVSPATYNSLAYAAHTFNVRAVNAAGTDATPASVSWTITLPVPDTTITGNPGTTTSSTSASFTFTSTPAGATFQCSLDGAAFTACTSPQAYSGLALTGHTFSVRAVNAAGTDATPATFAWTISNSIPNLVLALGFEEGTGATTADSSGSGNNGALANTSWSAAGRFGRALSFNGTSSWVTVADANSLDLTTAMTIEAWVNPAVNTDWRTVLLKENASGLSYSLYGSGSPAVPSTWMRVGSAEREVNGTAALAVNTWTHLAATYDGATMRLFVNGVQVGTRALAGSLGTSTAPLRIGGNAIWGEYFSGLIDEVRVYNRVLTAAEIQADMAVAIRP